MARTPAPGARQRILETADRLFYEKGLHAVGLQEIVDACGCGKNLLYREFSSKDDLVGAYLEARHEQWRRAVEEATAPLADDPARQIVAIVELVAEQVGSSGYCGCPFLKAHAEFDDPRHPGRRIPRTHLRELSDELYSLARRARSRRPRVVADRIMLVIEGLYATGDVLGHALVRSALELTNDIVDGAATAPRKASRRVVAGQS